MAVEVVKQAGYARVGVEVKARGSLRPEDLRGLKFLAQALGPRFHWGAVLYLGRKTVPFAKDLHALPSRPSGGFENPRGRKMPTSAKPLSDGATKK